MELQQENTQPSTALPPQKAIGQMASGYMVSQSLYAAAKLGLADLLKDGAKSCEDLASSVGVHPRLLYRLMRALASVGVFAEQEPGYFTLTPFAACLQSDVAGSMRASVITCGAELYQAWGDILYSLRTGGSAFEHLYGMPMELNQENTQPSTALPPQKAIGQMVSGYMVSQSLYAAAKLGLADLLKDGAKSCEDLASSAGVHPRLLYRLMRALASVGVFAEQEPGYFTLTPFAACLQSDVAGSMRASVITCGAELYQAWGDILYSLRTGGSAFEHLYGMPLFQFYAQNPESGKMFDEAMTKYSSAENFEIVASYDFSGIHKLVDVGGGQGSLIASLLKANPKMQGILFDRQSVIEGAKNLTEVEGVSQRCELVGGDFLESVPSGADAYMLKHVLHDWDDKSAITIVKNCHHAMVENGKLLVMEQVIPPGNEPCFGKFTDLTMMVMFTGARQRTEPEYRALFEASGFKLTKIVPIRENVSLLEGIRV